MSPMPLRRLLVTLLLVLAVLGILGPRGLAWAHSPFKPGSEVASEIVPRSDGHSHGNDLPGWALAAAPDTTPGVPWSALAIVAAAVTVRLDE